MLINQVIQELYANNLQWINDITIINIVTNVKSYKSVSQYLNLCTNDKLIYCENDLVWDLTLGFPFPDNSLTSILCDDFFNQLNYDEQTYFLTEALRCLKDTGTIDLNFDSVDIPDSTDINFNRVIKTIPASAFINSCKGLQDRIISLGIDLKYINIKEVQPLSLEYANHNLMEITKPVGFIHNNVPCIQELTPDLFNNTMPKISVLYLTYNQSEYIHETIESILQQSYTNFEIIWGDDGSTDTTILYMIKYKNKYPNLVKTPFYGVKNVGRVRNLKRSIDIAKGEYVSICEGDDVWLTRTRLKRQLNFMIDHDFDCSVTQAILAINTGQTLIRAIDKKLISYQDVLDQTHLCTLSAMLIKKEIFDDAPKGFWDLEIADYVVGLYVTLRNKLGLGFLNSDPIVYRVHANALWSSLSEKQRSKSILELQKKFTSLFNMKDIDDTHNTLIGPINTDFIIFDDQYPVRNPIGWRSNEFEYYNSKLNTTIMSFETNQDIFNHKNILPYTIYIIPYTTHRKINAKLAYALFLNNIYKVLSLINTNNIPFVFTLYPGGGFCLNDKESDTKLQAVCSSPFFQKVIVTQEITRNYLLEHNFCTQEQIKYIYGGVKGFKETQIGEQKYYNGTRSECNICFCAFKYTKRGVDKGYDIFIEVGKILSTKYDNIHFHVICNFDEHDISCDNIKNIHFHGPLFNKDYENILTQMDFVISCPRFGAVQTGAFNGFPLNIDFAYVGVPIITTDELNCNTNYSDGEDILIVDFDPNNIVKRIEYYYNNLDKLKILSEKCLKRTRKLFSDEVQLGQRMEVLTSYLK